MKIDYGEKARLKGGKKGMLRRGKNINFVEKL